MGTDKAILSEGLRSAEELPGGAEGLAPVLQPERRLAAAVLFDGIQGYLQNQLSESTTKKRSTQEAYEWVERTKEVDYIFSFESCCEALGLSPRSMRESLKRVVAQQSGEWTRIRKAA